MATTSSPRSCTLLLALIAMLVLSATTAFQAPNPTVVARRTTTSTTSALGIFKKKKDDEDLSFIETRDMTRKEMEELNKQNEDIMNAELIGMTVFSLIISIPLLYLAWVGFFADTAEIAGDLSPYAQ